MAATARQAEPHRPALPVCGVATLLALELSLVFSLILLNGFFAMSELAIVSARRARLQQHADNGSRGARIAPELADDPNRFLSTVQIGITLIGILAGTFSGATIAERPGRWALAQGAAEAWAEPVAVVLVVLAVTYLSPVVGELVPKRIAMTHADAIASRVAPVISALSVATRPAYSCCACRPQGCCSGCASRAAPG